MNRPASIELHIEELVLHGFSPGDRHRIAGAVQTELTRLLADPATRASLGASREIPRLDGGAFQVPSSGPRPESIGVQVAKSLHQGLKR